ncbi:MAG: hypothetical protein FJW36_20360 [Acidobacteria bacterium]|nr:hypothetical protein [Acidobacteriota bacterium]
MKKSQLTFKILKLLLLRSLRDPEAKKILWTASRPLLIFILAEGLLLAFLAWTFPVGRTREFWIFIGFILICGLLMGWIRRRMLLNDAVISIYPLNTSLQPCEEVKRYLRGRLRIVRGMLLRAAEDSATTRQMQNEDLRKAELWDQLEREERDLAMASGGTWPEEARQQLG